jgi:hypothetical protein
MMGNNERIKRRYVQYLKEVRGFGDVATDQFAKAIDRFETYTRFTDFEKFHVEQVRGFKQHLYEQTGLRSKSPLSHATIYGTLNTLKAGIVPGQARRRPQGRTFGEGRPKCHN